MPRQSKGAHLYLRKGRIDARSGKQLPDRWFIRDGTREVGTGCGPERLGEAEEALARYIGAKWTPPVAESDPARVSIADVLALYNHERAAKLKSDVASLTGFTMHLLAWWTGKTVADVRRTTCNAYTAYRTAQPIRHGATGRMVSAQTARRELEFLSAAIGYWDDEHHLTRRPTVVLPEKPESNRDALSRPQAARLLWASLGWDRVDGKWTRPSTNARTNRLHLRRFILIGLYTGSRSGVIKRLRWAESPLDPWVDLEAGIIYRRGRGEAESRTKRRPLVKLPKRLLAHMRRWYRLDTAKGHASVLHFGQYAVGSIRTGFAGCAGGAGLQGVTPHWLRHTAATWLVERNVDTWEAAGYLGMTAATLEAHYGHHRPDHQSAARKAMG